MRTPPRKAGEPAAAARTAGSAKATKAGKAGKARKAGPASRTAGAAAKLWQLRLYVMDETPRSVAALANLRRICESHVQGRYRITVIDLMKHPRLARGDQILATPTVVRRLPTPVRTIIGNLSDTNRVLVGLDLRADD